MASRNFKPDPEPEGPDLVDALRSLASDMTGELAANLDQPYDEDASWQPQWARLRDEALRLVHVTHQPCATCGAVIADEREPSGDTHPWTESLEALKEALDRAHRRGGALAIVAIDENGAVCPGDDDLSFFADLENTTGTELLIEWAYERHRCALGTGDKALAQFLELRLAEAEARAHRQAMLAQLWRRQWQKTVKLLLDAVRQQFVSLDFAGSCPPRARDSLMSDHTSRRSV